MIPKWTSTLRKKLKTKEELKWYIRKNIFNTKEGIKNEQNK